MVFKLERTREDGRKTFVTRIFSINTAVDPLSLLARARKVARENEATLVGDERSARFSREMVRGEYLMVGQRVTVTITDKHWLVPWPLVESQVRTLVE